VITHFQEELSLPEHNPDVDRASEPSPANDIWLGLKYLLRIQTTDKQNRYQKCSGENEQDKHSHVRPELDRMGVVLHLIPRSFLLLFSVLDFNHFIFELMDLGETVNAGDFDVR
jgi:hypothetical protein